MPRRPRRALDGLIFHVLNRGVRRALVFRTAQDYGAFESVLAESVERTGMSMFAYCLMPNHWHLVVSPNGSDHLSQFMHWLTLTHTQRWHACHGTLGSGPLYQGRYKSFPIQSDAHFLTVCRYVERNPARAQLVETAQDWPWSSLARRCENRDTCWLEAWPIPQPAAWLDLVNETDANAELAGVRTAVQKGAPFGDSRWARSTAELLGLESTMRPRGRPKKGVGSLFAARPDEKTPDPFFRPG